MSWMRLLAVSRSIGPVGHQPSRYKMMTGALPRLRRRESDRRTPEAAASVRVSAPEDAGETKSITSQRKVAEAPAKAGWTLGMFGIFKKIFFGKDPKMKALEAAPCLTPHPTLEVPPQAYP